jgi:hypothetical protein
VLPPDAGGRFLVCVQRHVPPQLRINCAGGARLGMGAGWAAWDKFFQGCFERHTLQAGQGRRCGACDGHVGVPPPRAASGAACTAACECIAGRNAADASRDASRPARAARRAAAAALRKAAQACCVASRCTPQRPATRAR